MRRDTHESALAREQVMLDRLCAAVKTFYENPKNKQAYEAWKQNKEANYESDNNYGRYDPGKP